MTSKFKAYKKVFPKMLILLHTIIVVILIKESYCVGKRLMFYV